MRNSLGKYVLVVFFFVSDCIVKTKTKNKQEMGRVLQGTSWFFLKTKQSNKRERMNEKEISNVYI